MSVSVLWVVCACVCVDSLSVHISCVCCCLRAGGGTLLLRLAETSGDSFNGNFPLTMTFLFVLAVVGWLSAVVGMPSDWEARVNSFNALYAESDLDNLNVQGYPGIYIPLIGNGYL